MSITVQRFSPNSPFTGAYRKHNVLCNDHGGLRGPCCASQWTLMVGSSIPVAWEFF